MKNRLFTIMIILSLLAVLLTSCSSTASTATSWGAASLSDSTIYYSSGTKVYALKPENGNSKWEYPTEKTSATRLFLAAPVEVGEQVLVGDYAGILTSLNVRDGKENWQFKEAKGKYIDSPLVVNETIFAPNADHTLYALDLNGNKLWSFSASQSFWAQPVSDGTMIFAPSLDHSLYALDITSGDMKWKTDLSAALVGRATLADGILYLGNLEGEVFAVNSENGKKIWNQKVGGGVWSAPILKDGKLYFGDQSGNINVLNAENGAIEQTVSTGSPVLGTGAMVEDGILFGDEKGELMLIGFDGVKNWTRSVNGALYSNLATNGNLILVIANKGEKPLVAMNVQGNEIWYKE